MGEGFELGLAQKVHMGSGVVDEGCNRQLLGLVRGFLMEGK